MFLGRLLGSLCLTALSLTVLRLVPEKTRTLAELVPVNPLFYFEMQPQSTFYRNFDGSLVASMGDDQQWVVGALEKLTDRERRLMQPLITDPATRFSISVFNLNDPKQDRIDFLVVAETSGASFVKLTELGHGLIGQAIPPAYYIEMQEKPRLGVFVGEPPKRLYVCEDFPIYAVSNSPDLILRLLQVRYKGFPGLVQQAGYRKLRRAVSDSEGALLFVGLSGVIDRVPRLRSEPLISILQALSISDWKVLGYHWSRVQGQMVRRVILVGE